MTFSRGDIYKTLSFCYFHRICVFLISGIIKNLQASITLPDLKFAVIHLAPREQIYFAIMDATRAHHRRHCFFIRLIFNLPPLDTKVILIARTNC